MGQCYQRLQKCYRTVAEWKSIFRWNNKCLCCTATCAKVGSESHSMSLLANSTAAAVRLPPHCYKCGQQGHMKINCPRKPILLETFQGQRNVNINCNQCGDPVTWPDYANPESILMDSFLRTREIGDQVWEGDTHWDAHLLAFLCKLLWPTYRKNKRISWNGCFHLNPNNYKHIEGT